MTNVELEKIFDGFNPIDCEWVIHDHSNDGVDAYGIFDEKGNCKLESSGGCEFTFDHPTIIKAFANGLEWWVDEDLGGEHGALCKSNAIDVDGHDLVVWLIKPFNSDEELQAAMDAY